MTTTFRERDITWTQLSVMCMASGDNDGEGEASQRAEEEEELSSLEFSRIRAEK